MNYGNFFKLDNYSNIASGQVAFRYLQVKKKSNKKNFQDVFYPIYLVFNQHSVDFYLHQGENEGNEDQHIHVRILHLPLSQNLSIKDTLTTILRTKVYDEFYDLENNYEVIYDKNLLAYWNLDVFSPKDYKKYKNKIAFRKLILDFLYDLEHSSVFNNCRLVEVVEVKLKENFLFNAIAAKASYYWLRTKLNKNKFDRRSFEIYGKNLVVAEEQWLNTIQDNLSLTLFPNSGGWFKNSVEKEAKEVLFSRRNFDRYKWKHHSIIAKDFDKRDEIHVLRKTAQWFTRRYSIINAIKTITQYNKNFLPALIFVFIISNLFFIDTLKITSFTIENFIIYICTSFLSFILLMFIIYYKLTLPLLGLLMPRLIMAISSAWLFFITSEGFWKSSFDVDIITNFSVILLLIPVVLFMGIEIYNIAPDISTPRLILRVTGILMIGMIYSILIGTLFINFTGKKIFERSGYLTTFYKKQLIADKNLEISEPYKLIASICDSSKFDNYYNFINEKDSVINAKLNYIKYKFAKPSEVDTIIKKSRRIEKIIIYNIHKNYLLDKENLTFKSFYAALIKNEIISGTNLFLGLKCVQFKSCKLPLLQKINIGLPLLKKIIIFPGMLCYGVIYTLFIGIFIQLIFEEKPITEPL